MKVRCMFQCNSITKKIHWGDAKHYLYEAEFSAVSGKDEETKKFFEATPFGTLKVGTFKDDYFEPGKVYYVDLIPVDEEK